ncbi:uncharacterized protein LOC135826349 [Sycon ciliatum]|uniref:uncharacterized protein LOC135826349 n=1 Tax=Sycon ciliatum TaxID=27933 RepID=UPI0031F6218B
MSSIAFLSAILLLLATAALSVADPIPPSPSPANMASAGGESCMVRWILQSGVELAMAERYEGVFKTIGMTKAKLLELDTDVLAFLMGMTGDHATMLKSCLDGTNPLCADAFNPCNTEGECVFNTDTRSYMCQCQPGRTGQYCENEIDECASEPCQNGGRCIDAFNNFTCDCSVGYEGDVCQQRWWTRDLFNALNASLATEKANVDILQSQLAEANRTIRENLKENANLQSQLLAEANHTIQTRLNGHSDRIHGLEGHVSTLQTLQQCNSASLGFAYKSQSAGGSGRRQLASVQITKRRASTLLRITYSTTIWTRGDRSASRWLAKIDGQECTQPSPIHIAHYRRDVNGAFIPGYLVGLCRATSSGPIAQGHHVITIHTGTIAPYPHSANSGWLAPSLLEVREICAR